MIRATIALLGTALYILLAGPPTILITRLFGTHHFLYSVARWGARWALFLAGGELTVVGREKIRLDRNYIFMPNHESNIDPIGVFLSISHDVRVIGKKEFFKVPLLSTACRLERFVAVDRRNHDSAVQSIEQAIRQLREGDSFLIYPEGTRTKTGTMGEFRKGGFIAAIRSKVPIVPMSLSGCYEMMRKGEFKIRPGRVKVIIHDPIDVSHYTLEDRDSLMERVRQVISSGIDKTINSGGEGALSESRDCQQS
jgi:1-acyl-sn-glycerol-3-phosphate acyltransferase